MEARESQCASKFMEPPNNIGNVPVLDLDANEEGFVNVEGQNGRQPTTPNSFKVPSKKITSEAWEYFTRIVVNGVSKAQCNYCKSTLAAGGSAGTSHLLKHAKNTCVGRHLKIAPGQTR